MDDFEKCVAEKRDYEIMEKLYTLVGNNIEIFVKVEEENQDNIEIIN